MESLAQCLDSITSSNHLLTNSITSLQYATQDFPRVSTILTQDTKFTTVPECEVLSSSQLHNSITPHLQKMLEQIDVELDNLHKKKQLLLHKVDLQNIRLDTYNELNKFETKPHITGTDTDLQRLKFLSNKKQRLQYSLSKFQLQDKKRRLSTI